MPQSPHHNHRLDWARAIALLAVVVIHTKPFMSSLLINQQPWIGMLMNQLARFAVPLFFVIAGYLIQPRLVQSTAMTLRSYSRPLLRMWGLWTLLYLLLPFNLATLGSEGYLVERSNYWRHLASAPLDSLLEGGMVHLWYIPGLLCALGLTALLVNRGWLRWLLPMSLALYLIGLLAGSYQSLSGIDLGITTRNGPFFSWLMLALGFEARRRHWQLSPYTAMAMMLIGMNIHIFEGLALSHFEVDFISHDFLFGTPLWGMGLFMLLIGLPDTDKRLPFKLSSEDVLGIYLCHMLVLIYLFNLAGMLQLSPLLRDVLITPLTCVISWLWVRGIKLTPLQLLVTRQTA